MHQTVAPPPAAEEDTADAVIAAARTIARIYTITPHWRDRLIREAVALIDAVHAHDRGRPT